ncbi:MAG TPA: T9SS type A sorting domain-containing protein [Chitinophagales bacterium]|nr:T9SS type A sorting domain-containing protein [Chitinophagales bacterium]
MKRLLFLLFAISALSLTAQVPWSYASQGTDTWPAANAKDLLVGADDETFVFGDIGLIDINEGAFTLAAIASDGSVVWEQTYDKPGTLEMGMRMSRTSDDGFLLSGMTAPDYRPYFVRTDADGNEMWNSASVTDLLPENSASQCYAYELPSGNIAYVFSDDVYKFLTRIEVDPATGAAISTTTLNYLDILPAGIGTVITANTVDMITNNSGDLIVIADFMATGADTTDYIFGINSDFELAGRFGISNGAPNYYANSVIQNADGDYIITGTKNTGAFFDLYSPMITLVQGGFLWSSTLSFTPTLSQATGGAITQTTEGGYKWIRYQQNGTYFDPAVGDYVEVATLDMWLTETATHTINYAPYNTFECIAALAGTPAIDDAYVIGGSAWTIGVPAYNLVIGTGAADAMPACIFNCVWPGDADNSGLVDMDDLLSIGLGFGNTGAARDAIDISWTAHQAEAWATALPGGINHKYTDCNGDGIIDATDEDAVDINYGFDHEVNTMRMSEGDVPLYYAPVDPIVIGENAIPIMLGDVATPVDAIYGLRFTATVDGESIDASSVYVTFNDSWIGNTSEMLQLSKTLATPAADAGLVKTTNENANGYGEIGTLHFVVIDNIAGKITSDEITIGFADARAINVNNEDLSLNTSELTVDVTLATNNPSQPAISIYPNPVSNNLIYTNLELVNARVTISDMVGREIVLEQVNGNTIQLPQLATGNYLMRITQSGGTSVFTLSLQ